jgi:hypothetical protein
MDKKIRKGDEERKGINEILQGMVYYATPIPISMLPRKFCTKLSWSAPSPNSMISCIRLYLCKLSPDPSTKRWEFIFISYLAKSWWPETNACVRLPKASYKHKTETCTRVITLG